MHARGRSLYAAEGEELSAVVQLLGATQLAGRKFDAGQFEGAPMARIGGLPVGVLPHRPVSSDGEPTPVSSAAPNGRSLSRRQVGLWAVLPVARPTSSVEFDDVGEPCQPSRLQLLRQLGHDVEPGRGGGLSQSPRQLEFDLVFGAAWALLISPRLPHAGVNTPDLGSPRIVDRACFLDPR